VSYDIYFLRREAGQSWEDAMDALEEQADNDGDPSRPAQWDQVASGVREVLGDVSVLEGPPNWEIYDEKTAIQVHCLAGEWSITVPYWYDGEHAEAIAGYLRAVAGIVHDATDLDAYDPQVGEDVMSSEWMSGEVVVIFDQVAESFRQGRIP
jgi:hypothetical protein